MKFDDSDEYTAASDKEIDMRSYQLELAYNASKGNNSIVLAGTGSGKTRIAIYLIKKHLDNNPTGIQICVFVFPSIWNMCEIEMKA